MDKKSIIRAIILRVESAKTKNYSIWTIGITQSHQQRKKEHGNPPYWQMWRADTLKDAQEMESYFINEKGMKGGTGGDLEPQYITYVYIF